MGLRFRRTFRVMPGVRINLSGGGLSTSIGVPGASLNLGRRGARTTVGLPGTGLSYSSRVAGQAAATAESWPDQAPAWTPPPAVATAETRRIGSTGKVGSRTSVSLLELKDLVTAAREQRADAEDDLRVAREELAARTREFAWKGHVLLRWLFPRRAKALEGEVLPETRAEIQRLEAWRDASTVQAEFDETGEAAATWEAVERAFDELAHCSAIWDITADSDVDRARTRSVASRSVDRQAACFSLEPEATLQSARPAPRLQNLNGEDVHLYPMLAVTPGVGGDFALIAFDDLNVGVAPVRFVEEEPLPADAVVIGQAWERSNKDGSRDNRYADNRQLPICQYGVLTLSSASGLNEEWQVSSWEALRAFGAAWSQHLAALRRMKPQA